MALVLGNKDGLGAVRAAARQHVSCHGTSCDDSKELAGLNGEVYTEEDAVDTRRNLCLYLCSALFLLAGVLQSVPCCLVLGPCCLSLQITGGGLQGLLLG